MSDAIKPRLNTPRVVDVAAPRGVSLTAPVATKPVTPVEPGFHAPLVRVVPKPARKSLPGLLQIVAAEVPLLAGTRVHLGESTLPASVRIGGVVDTSGWQRTELRGAGWYEQISGYTCQPSSIANAILAVGQRPDAVAFSALIEQVERSPSGISMRDTLAALGTERVTIEAVSVPASASIFEKTRLSDTQLWNVVHDAVAQHQPVLGGVKFASYNGGHGKHAIAITGFAESPTGERAVKVIDSEAGVFWMNLADLNRSLQSDKLFVLTKAS